jgi:hypothetical protein
MALSGQSDSGGFLSLRIPWFRKTTIRSCTPLDFRKLTVWTRPAVKSHFKSHREYSVLLTKPLEWHCGRTKSIYFAEAAAEGVYTPLVMESV